MKIDRLMALTIYLLNHGKTSAQKLAEEFEVSTRTIMRDMDTLGQAGIPIQSTYGADGGFQIVDNFVMDRQLADQKDYASILAALKGLASAYTNKNINQTIEKMNLVDDHREIPVRVDLSVGRENQEINETIHRLEEAVKQRRVVRFQYTNNADEVKQIEAEPVCVIYKWFNWYLVGYYEKYKDYCMFKLVRMEQLTVTDSTYTKEHVYDENLVEHNDTKKNIEIKLYGKAKIKSKCKEYLNGAIVKEYENGDFEFHFTVPEQETYWYGVILSFGNLIRILEPQSVIERILRTCNEIGEEYRRIGENDNE
ncbi:transcriptional regulator, DeoR family [Lachnospiraceae bacterium KM106-2]|nr:transcriptional regulator, DeoR family [Lachnospiraceae bacterium KM106-2]